MDAAVVVRDLRKEFVRSSRRHRFLTLKSALVKGELFRSLASREKVEALRDVSFQVERGTTFGIIGENGSGKSTLLKLLAGILRPTAGDVEVRGRAASLIELGAGFHPEISGRENVRINAIMLGLSRREIDLRFDSIVEFAGIGEFLDDAVKTYSSGMYARLGFAVAVSVDPEVLMVDEILAVGDEAFSRKCVDKFKEFRRLGKTIVIVSHDLDTIERLCDVVLWLKKGQTVGLGLPREIIDAYRGDVEQLEEKRLLGAPRSGGGASAGPAAGGAPEDGFVRADGAAPGGADKGVKARRRWGAGGVEIRDIRLVSAGSEERRLFHSGERMDIVVDIDAQKPVTDFVFGIGIFNAEGVCCYGTNTDIEGFHPGRLFGAARVAFGFPTLDLVEGTYYVDAAVHRKDGFAFDYRHFWLEFQVRSARKDIGGFRPGHGWSFTGDIEMVSPDAT